MSRPQLTDGLPYLLHATTEPGTPEKESPPPPPETECWELADLFPDEGSFMAAMEEMKKVLPSLDRYRGELASSPETLAKALNDIDEAVKKLNLLNAYASMNSDTDTRVARFHGIRQEVELLWNECSKRTAYLRPEILEIDPALIERFLEQEEGLKPHAFFLRDLLRTREHVLSPPEERVMAEASLITGTAGNVYNIVHNAELPRPDVTLSDGSTVTLTSAEFARKRTTSNRDDRETLFYGYYGAYESFKGTLGVNLYEGVKSHMFRARSRHYDSCLAASLHDDNVPETVYRNLIDQVHEQLPVLHRYFALRARALGLDRPGYHDLHCPLSHDLGTRHTVADAMDLVLRSIEPLGTGYVKAMQTAFDQRWIDWHPTAGKRSGAYASGAAFDVHPYVLMNFNGDYESVSTLAHEMGHALHSHFSNLTQPYATSDYSIFVAEVASTFNEAMLNARMFEEAGTEDEQLFLIGTYLDQMRATLFRQTMFAEFELLTHEKAEAGEGLTGESLNDIYLGLLRMHHGHEQDVMEIPDLFAVEWAAVPHFYYNFYVYQYATGIVAATALSEAVLAGEKGATERYTRFLGTGGSDHPLALLREAGVDLESPEPYRLTMQAISRQLDRLEEILDRRDGQGHAT